MNIIEKIKNKVVGVSSQYYIANKTKELAQQITDKHSKPRIYFFCTPTHSNLGDQAQLFCWLRLFKEWHPGYEVVCVPTRYRSFATIRTIHKNLQKNDIIYVHSGYLIFDPHPELPFILDIVRGFYDTKITILPQTVNLVGEWFQHIVAQVFNSHPNLTLYCRDEVSLENAKKLFPKVEKKLMPDVVTSLIGNAEFQYPNSIRKGVMLCVRNDGEKLYSDEQIDSLRKRFDGIKTDICDTTIYAPIWEWENNRSGLIRNMLEAFSKYQVIITDRYHGTIFSQIVNTPVIVISSTDHKLSSGVKWFPKELFEGNITFAIDLDEAYNKATEILARNGKQKKNPAWFKNTYYNKAL